MHDVVGRLEALQRVLRVSLVAQVTSLLHQRPGRLAIGGRGLRPRDAAQVVRSTDAAAAASTRRTSRVLLAGGCRQTIERAALETIVDPPFARRGRRRSRFRSGRRRGRPDCLPGRPPRGDRGRRSIRRRRRFGQSGRRHARQVGSSPLPGAGGAVGDATPGDAAPASRAAPLPALGAGRAATLTTG